MSRDRCSRREFLRRAGAGLALGAGAVALGGCRRRTATVVGPAPGGTDVFVARAPSYSVDIGDVIGRALRELGIGRDAVAGRRVLLKPNLVEPHLGAGHVNTHPAVVHGAAAAFLRLGAAQVLVAEGAGHCRDTFLVLDESGLAEALAADRLRFVDLNYEPVMTVPNAGQHMTLRSFHFPKLLGQVDWLVSLAKLKTHHWAGVTLAMKNLFGTLPGRHYGWPKNVLHQDGLVNAILDLNATLGAAFAAPGRAHLALVDGIVGMEGDGPIMGAPRPAGVLVVGRSFVAVDATCTRIMGIDPARVPYLAAAGGLGPIGEAAITQRGEAITAVRTPFALLDRIAVHRELLGAPAAAPILRLPGLRHQVEPGR